MKNLLDKVFPSKEDEQEEQGDDVDDVEDVDQEKTQSEPQGETENTRPVIQVESEKIQPLEDMYDKLSRTQLKLGQIEADYQRQKKEVLDKIEELGDEIEEEVNNLREYYGIPEDDDNYSLNLPKEGQNHGYFLRDGHGEKDLDPSKKPEDNSETIVGESEVGEKDAEE